MRVLHKTLISAFVVSLSAIDSFFVLLLMTGQGWANKATVGCLKGEGGGHNESSCTTRLLD